jgi:hypothetical protein
MLSAAAPNSPTPFDAASRMKGAQKGGVLGLPGSGAWRAFLTEQDRVRAMTVVRELANLVMTEYPLAPGTVQNRGYSLGSGYLGHALLLAYAGEVFREEAWSKGADRLVSVAMTEVPGSRLVPGLFGHAVGFGWVAAHFARYFAWFEAIDLDDLDEALRGYVLGTRPPTNYDLISGLVGVGVYALERLPSDAGAEIIKAVVSALAREAVEDDGDLTWITPPSDTNPELRRHFPHPSFNFGVAHGIPGVIGFLGRVVLAGVHNDLTLELLRRASSWLVKHPLGYDSPSFYSCRTDLAYAGPPSRLAWCYGDAGILPQIFAAADALSDRDLYDFGIRVGVKSLRRVSRGHGVIDPALCHGSAGLLHLYNRLWQFTSDERFRDFALVWFADTFARRESGRGAAGFPFITPNLPAGATYEKMSEWQTGFLEGTSGIGLALLASVSDGVPPHWDRLLLADLPERSR